MWNDLAVLLYVHGAKQVLMRTGRAFLLDGEIKDRFLVIFGNFFFCGSNLVGQTEQANGGLAVKGLGLLQIDRQLAGFAGADPKRLNLPGQERAGYLDISRLA